MIMQIRQTLCSVLEKIGFFMWLLVFPVIELMGCSLEFITKGGQFVS